MEKQNPSQSAQKDLNQQIFQAMEDIEQELKEREQNQMIDKQKLQNGDINSNNANFSDNLYEITTSNDKDQIQNKYDQQIGNQIDSDQELDIPKNENEYEYKYKSIGQNLKEEKEYITRNQKTDDTSTLKDQLTEQQKITKTLKTISDQTSQSGISNLKEENVIIREDLQMIVENLEQQLKLEEDFQEVKDAKRFKQAGDLAKFKDNLQQDEQTQQKQLSNKKNQNLSQSVERYQYRIQDYEQF